MKNFDVSIIDDDGVDLLIPHGVVLSPQRYDKYAIGGCNQAEIQAEGPVAALWTTFQWLGKRAVIYNRNLSPVWWGVVSEVEISLGSSTAGLSILNMQNRVATAYTTDSDGITTRGTTDWEEDAESIAAYGYHEKLGSLANTNLVQAEKKRDTILAAMSAPGRILSLGGNTGGVATIRCTGYWSTLEWRYYQQLAGLESHEESGGTEQALGQGFTDTTIGFSKHGKIHDLTGRMDAFISGHKIEVTGSASNNIAAVITATTSQKQQVYASTSIDFDANDDIRDLTLNQLSFIAASDFFTCTGSSVGGNNITYRCRQSSDDALVVGPQTVTTSSAGPTITLTRGNNITTDGATVREFPGATVTLTAHGEQIAQSFSLEANTSWTVANILLRMRRVGSPADNVLVQLCSDTAGAPGTVLDSQTVVGATIGTRESSWVVFEMSNADTITYGTTYWIVVSRSGANEARNYYVVEVDEDLGYTRGALKLWDGAAWQTRATDADMLFQVQGSVVTTTQLSTLITTSGQFISAVDIKDASGVSSIQYRNGDNLAIDEATDLIATGTSAGERLLVDVTVEQVARIYKRASADDDTNYIWGRDGQLKDAFGHALEHGKLPVGNWIAIEDIPPAIGAMTKLSPFFCESASIDCNTGKVTPVPEGQPDAWNIGEISEG